MASRTQKAIVLALLRGATDSLSPREILGSLDNDISERSLRRWLAEWLQQGLVTRTGAGRSTRYQAVPIPGRQPGFLDGLADNLRREVLTQVRDLWTHSSTALEGNTLSLGDTRFVIDEGLTISGKPLKDHQEVIGHARAIDVVYEAIDGAVDERLLFTLHKAVQTDVVTDIYKPQGAWKLERNFTHAVDADGRSVLIEYARPADVPALMSIYIDALNAVETAALSPDDAHLVYARFHIAFVHVHPFWDGNGRLARLIANLPLLRAGLPPLTIPGERRREYIQILADYQVQVGRLTPASGLWPNPELLRPFESFCGECFRTTRELVAAAFRLQEQSVG